MLSVIVATAWCFAFAMVDSDGYIFIEERMNWIDANLKCMEDNATLATISNMFQYEEALSACQSESCWIGLSNIFGSYRFIDQTALTYSTTFCDTSSILSCVSINNGNNINNTQCHWTRNDCKDVKMSFLCNIPSDIASTSASKCNYFVDSTTLLPHAIDICSSDSRGMNTVYTCGNRSDDINAYTVSNCTSWSIDDDDLSVYIHPFANNVQCTASVCGEYDIVSVIQYNYTNNEKRCSQDMYMNEEHNPNEMDWTQMDLVIGVCFPSHEYYNLYTQLTCSNAQVDKLFYNDSDCTDFQFGATILSHNACSIDGRFGYHIQHCGTELYQETDGYSNDYEYGYVNDGTLPKPMNKCQSVYSYTLSYKYICIYSRQRIVNRIWFDNTDCNGFHYFDVTLSLDDLVDFNCNNRIATNTININYYHDVADHTNPSIVYTQSIIVNQCFRINSTYSFRYKCTDNTTLRRLLYANGINCAGEAMIDVDGLNNEDEGTAWIGIPKCNVNESLIISMGPSWSSLDLIDTHKKAKIFMFVLLALFVATCLMFAVFGILVWNYFKTQTGKTNAKSKKKYMDISGSNTSNNTSQKRKYTETDPKSVISYDVEDNGDLPGIDLWKARKRSSYSSPPVSENTATLPPLPKTPVMLLPVDSADTCTTGTNYTNKGMDVSTIIDDIESIRHFSGEYYEPSPHEYVD